MAISFTPGINFLPSSQGAGQGGSGQFYGTNPYLSGGILWHPMPQLGLTASITWPSGVELTASMVILDIQKFLLFRED